MVETERRETKIKYKGKVLGERRLLESVEENSMLIFRAVQEVLNLYVDRKETSWDKETWWWNEVVKDAIRANERCK